MVQILMPLWHETDWTVVSDPRVGTMTLSRFGSDGEAKIHLRSIQLRGDRHAYIVPPISACMRRH